MATQNRAVLNTVRGVCAVVFAVALLCSSSANAKDASQQSFATKVMNITRDGSYADYRALWGATCTETGKQWPTPDACAKIANCAPVPFENLGFTMRQELLKQASEIKAVHVVPVADLASGGIDANKIKMIDAFLKTLTVKPDYYIFADITNPKLGNRTIELGYAAKTSDGFALFEGKCLVPNSEL